MRWWVYWFLQIFASIVCKTMVQVFRITGGGIFFDLESKGLKNIPASGPIVITPNHKSFFDHFFILASLPLTSHLIPARFMAADWLFKIPFSQGGLIIRYLLLWGGAYPTHRGRGLDVSLRDPLRVLQNPKIRRRVVVIYPEGGIRFRQGIHEVKIGAAYLAQKSKAQVSPVAICGIEYLSLKSFFFGKRHVRVVFGEPFTLADKDVVQASQKIKEKIENLYVRHS
jgi:1-acyl-sn-glycerol-3-phosphate acyltransferase